MVSGALSEQATPWTAAFSDVFQTQIAATQLLETFLQHRGAAEHEDYKRSCNKKVWGNLATASNCYQTIVHCRPCACYSL